MSQIGFMVLGVGEYSYMTNLSADKKKIEKKITGQMNGGVTNATPCHHPWIKGSRFHLQISLNITRLCKDEKYTIMTMNMKSYSCRL